MTLETAATWKLSKQGERRLAQGHPWVFANELSHKPVLAVPGSLVKLESSSDHPLAVGYGNPHSLIVFRKLWDLTSKPSQQALHSGWVSERLHHAAKVRLRVWGQLKRCSFRLCYGEADLLPGLIVDCYDHAPAGAKVFCVQILTAGMEQAMSDAMGVFEDFFARCAQDPDLEPAFKSERSCVILRRDASVRKLENLDLRDTVIIHNPLALKTDHIAVSLRPSSSLYQEPVTLSVDLSSGQKTGLFLDQQFNTKITCTLLHHTKSKDMTVADLFCHLGQWGLQIGAHLRQLGANPTIHCFDASEQALNFARSNVTTFGLNVETHKMDLIGHAKDAFAGRNFDVVICDPPALIKNKKDVDAGTRGYIKINEAAIRAVAPGGFFVSCSCSHHLSEEAFQDMLAKACQRSGRRLQWIAKGQQSPDHPMSPLFPQGSYLKAAMALVD